MPPQIVQSTTERVRITVEPLGAGRDVGRSCILVRFADDRADPPWSVAVMLDCGLHVGTAIDGKGPFPDLSFMETEKLDACCVSHFHIDHIGALPHLTEKAGYNGLILMSGPTRRLALTMLEEQFSDGCTFTANELKECVKKTSVISPRETIELSLPNVPHPVLITAKKAGHVLGAYMFHVRVGPATLLYTGDFNATPDRQLGAYDFDPLPVTPYHMYRQDPLGLDVLITESTYGTTTRGSERSCEREFLDSIRSAVGKGGKVLIPTFSLGRVQEICALLEENWEGMAGTNIYLATREAETVARTYKDFDAWAKVPEVEHANNLFHGARKRLKRAQGVVTVGEPSREEMTTPGVPVVLICTSAMLVGGLSKKAFALWCGDSRNLVVFPGHCVSGTLGHRVLTMKERKESTCNVDRQVVSVKCGVVVAPFSSHTDSKGILQLVHQTLPRKVVLVHGVSIQMEALKRRMHKELPGRSEEWVVFPNVAERVHFDSVVEKRGGGPSS